jgi:hypothetical protein
MNIKRLLVSIVLIFHSTVLDETRQEIRIETQKSEALALPCYQEDIINFSKQYEICPALLSAVILIESNCQIDAVGLVGELGLGQIRKEFWKDFLDRQGIDDIKGVEAVASVLSYHVKKWGMKKGVERYNGKGKKAIEYRQKVMKKRSEILSL